MGAKMPRTGEHARQSSKRVRGAADAAAIVKHHQEYTQARAFNGRELEGHIHEGKIAMAEVQEAVAADESALAANGHSEPFELRSTIGESDMEDGRPVRYGLDDDPYALHAEDIVAQVGFDR